MAGETMDTDINAAFWLPTHFLTDDDLLSGDNHDLRRLNKEPTKNFDLFSNGFDPFAPHSLLDSPISSTDTDNKDNDYDDELVAELTRQLAHSKIQDNTHLNSNPTRNVPEKPWGVFSTSPQSTLSGFGPWSNRSGFSSNGSPNGPSQVTSPPLSPPGAKNDAAWELLYEAAGQVARLKMNAIAAQLNNQNRGLLGTPCNPSLSNKSHRTNGFYDYPHTNQFQQVKKQGSSMWSQGRQEREELYCPHHQQRRCCGGSNSGALGLPQSAWPPLRGQPQQPPPPPPPQCLHRQQSGSQGGSGMRAVFLGGSGSGPGTGSSVKRQSTGTGVFIPRRFGTQSQPEPRKKPTGCSTVLLPARVVQALNLDLEEINNGRNLNSQPRFGSGYVTDHEILMARRNALLSQQMRSLRPDSAATMVGHDIRLPSDWTY